MPIYQRFASTSVGLVSRLTAEVVDPESWERFVYTYGPQFAQWARDLGLQEADALDVAQEVLLRVSRSISNLQYDPQRSFRGWLYTVVRGAWADWARSRRRARDDFRDSRPLQRLVAESAEEQLLAHIEARYQYDLFQRASVLVRQRVTPTTWRIFEMLAVEGLSTEEVSRKLRVTRGNALAARCRVQRLLRQEVEALDNAP
ncbi:MAG: RNA polymerase sigma factor [Planctomycetaceae bacterium]|jgi:RNA polymerase sigma factor (sigma-70 family)